MKAFSIVTVCVFTLVSSALRGQSTGEIQKMEASGDTQGARTALARAAQDNPASVPALAAYAEILDRYGDPGCRGAYARLLTVLRSSGDTARAASVARRLAAL